MERNLDEEKIEWMRNKIDKLIVEAGFQGYEISFDWTYTESTKRAKILLPIKWESEELLIAWKQSTNTYYRPALAENIEEPTLAERYTFTHVGTDGLFVYGMQDV